MKTNHRCSENEANLLESRRTFLKEGFAALAGLLVFGSPAMGSYLDVTITRHTADDTPAGDTEKPTGVSKFGGREFEIVKKFLKERMEFDITFLGAKTAAGVLKFDQTGNNEYTVSAEGTTGNLVGALTSLRKVSMTSIMYISRVGGKERFVTRSFIRRTIKTDETVENRNEFDYLRRRWTYSKYKDGKKVLGPRVRRIPADRYYDDFLNLLYNFRAQVYGAVKPGLNLTLYSLPMERKVDVGKRKVSKTADTIGVTVKSPEQCDDNDRNWLKESGADFLVLLKVDKDVYGIPSGQAKFCGNNDMVPCGAWAKDAMLFGDVQVVKKKNR